jgi:hypothetical protein
MSGLSALNLAARLADLTDAWLEVRCCRGVAFLPLRQLAMDHGGARRVREVVAHLRCGHCRAHPALVALVGDPAGSAPGRAGAPPGWRVVLVRDPLARLLPQWSEACVYPPVGVRLIWVEGRHFASPNQ